jgi:hypothetical protein
MNSYFKMNRDYREYYLIMKNHKGDASEVEVPIHVAQKSDLYPRNVNYKDFLMYMLHPTFTYQDSYPVTQGGRQWKTIFYRVLLILLAVVSTTLSPLWVLFSE